MTLLLLPKNHSLHISDTEVTCRHLWKYNLMAGWKLQPSF